MEGDSIENYIIRIDGKKKYKCELCDYLATQKSHIESHLNGKGHRTKFETKPKSIPIPVNKENINMIITCSADNTPPKNSPPKTGLKGKTFLSTYCADALKLDVSLPFNDRYARHIDFDDEDWGFFHTQNPNQFLLHIFMKLIKKEGGINKFFFRCTDSSRKRFYYNDHNVGWTEDMLDLQLITFIRDLLAKYILKFLKPKAGETILARAMLYSLWGRTYESIEDSRNKSKKRADQEISECLDFLFRLLEINDSD